MEGWLPGVSVIKLLNMSKTEQHWGILISGNTFSHFLGSVAVVSRNSPGETGLMFSEKEAEARLHFGSRIVASQSFLEAH